MPEFKSGVVMWQMHPIIDDALLERLDKVSLRLLGRRAIITAARDGHHSPLSLHYIGQALDLRTRDLGTRLIPEYADALEDELGKDWDVVVESDHIHIEYDPEP